jgi:hypothetical protein
MLIFAADQELWARELIGRKDILKSVYYFMIIFLTVYILKYFLLLVPFSH